MNKSFETYPYYISNSGIYGRIYREPKRRFAKRGVFARVCASVCAFAGRLRSIRAIRIAAVSVSAAGLFAVAGLLETGLLPIVSGLLLASLCSAILVLFLRKNK